MVQWLWREGGGLSQVMVTTRQYSCYILGYNDITKIKNSGTNIVVGRRFAVNNSSII